MSCYNCNECFGNDAADLMDDHLVNDAALESEIGLTKGGVAEYHANVKKLREAKAGEELSHV